jgi:hypothetical protein
MRGETTPGVEVEVLADGVRISLLHNDELIGDWDVEDIGIQSLNDGFAIRAEGEEFVLRTDDDVAVAREMGLVAASPRLARKLAAAQNPDRPMPADPEPVRVSSNLSVLGFALASMMTIVGGFLLRADTSLTSVQTTIMAGLGSDGNFWSAFVIGGILMLAVALVMARNMPWARTAAIVVVAGLVILFGLAAQAATPDADHLLAYGFIAGGLVVAIAIVFAGSFGEPD